MLRVAKAKFSPQRLRLFWMHLPPHLLAKFARVAVDGIRIVRTAGDVRETGLRVEIVELLQAVIVALRQAEIAVETGIVVVAVAVAGVDVAGVCRIRSMPLGQLVAAMPLTRFP